MNRFTPAVFALAAFFALRPAPLHAAADELNGTVTVFGLELPLKPGTPDKALITQFLDKNQKLGELKVKITTAVLELQDAAGEENDGKRKRKIEKALEKLVKAEKNFYKEAKKIRQKYDKAFKPLKEKKEKIEEDIAEAEKRNDDKTATRLAQSLQKFSGKYESQEKMIRTINAYLYLPENEKLIEYAEMAGLDPERILPPELLDALHAFSQKNDAGKVKDKAPDDDDDRKKKNRKKNSKKDRD